jgi:hypothetical protein
MFLIWTYAGVFLMKYLLLLTTLLHSTLSLAYTNKIDFDGYKFKDIKKSKSMHMQAHKEKLLKKLQNISQNRKEKHQHRKKKIFHILKKLKRKYDKRQFNIQIVETDNANILRLKLSPRKTFFKKKEKYTPLSIQYNLGSEENFQDFQYESVVENINDEYFVDLDISSLEAGNYSASLKIQAEDQRFKRWRRGKKKLKNFYISVDFEKVKVESAFLVAENYRTLDGNSAVYFDTSASYSEGGEIISFKYETFLNGELKVDNVTEINSTQSVIRFREFGEWTVRITAVDSLGDEDSKEFNFTVTNTVPNIIYSYELDPNVPGHITIDLSQSSDPDGITNYESFYYKVNDDGSLNYWKYLSHGDSITTNLVNRGQNYICIRVTDTTGSFDVQCFLLNTIKT